MLFVVFASAIILTACAAQPLTVTRPPVHLRIVASNTSGPLLEDLTMVYQENRPWVTTQIQVFDSIVAEEQLQSGGANLIVLAGIGEDLAAFWSVPFARDDIAVVAHPTVPVEGLGLSQLTEIFQGHVSEWSDGVPVQVISQQEGTGLRTVFETVVLDGQDVTLTALVAPDDAAVLEAVASTPGTIGYVSWAGLEGGARVLAIDGALPGADGYGLSYSLFLVTLSEPTGGVRDFMQWVLGSEGQLRVMQRFGAVPRGF